MLFKLYLFKALTSCIRIYYWRICVEVSEVIRRCVCVLCRHLSYTAYWLTCRLSFKHSGVGPNVAFVEITCEHAILGTEVEASVHTITFILGP